MKGKFILARPTVVKQRHKLQKLELIEIRKAKVHFHIWNKEDEANQRPTLHKSISQLQEIDDNVAKNKEHNKQSKQLQQMWLKTLYPSCKSCYSIEVCKR